jgi:hypothetical protein
MYDTGKIMNARTLITAFAVAITMNIVAPIAAFATSAPYTDNGADDRAEREADLYEEGTDAIDDEQWDEAIRNFTAVAEMKGSKADGAIYWTAYALNRMGRRAEALKTIDGLRKSYPNSRWLDDAKALELELRSDRGETVQPASVEDAELKMIAINSLMHSDPEKAYPLLEKIVRGNTAAKKIKDRALFILSQSSSPRAQTLIGEIARGNSNPDMQKAAVRYLGINGNAKNRQILSELYATATTREVKKEVLRAFMISGDKGYVLTAAKGEKDPELREEAIRALGVMGARAELAAMYDVETVASVKERIIQGLFIGGDSEKIGELARKEKDVELRKEAIQKLGLMGGKNGPMLLSLYANETSTEIKSAILNGLFLSNNARALIDIAKKETNKDLKRTALKKLSIMNDDEALAYMLQILNE